MIKPEDRGHGGPRPGSGRPADWLKAKCRDLVKKHKLLDFLCDVANGEYVQTVVTSSGQKLDHKVSADVQYRLKALDMMLDRGFGKASQEIEHKGVDGIDFVTIWLKAEEKRGLKRPN